MSEQVRAYYYSNPTARKDHECCECEGTILRGERYHKHWGVWDIEIMAFKRCKTCEEIANELEQERLEKWPDADPICFGELMDHVVEASPVLLTRFIGNGISRGQTFPQWMLDKTTPPAFAF